MNSSNIPSASKIIRTAFVVGVVKSQGCRWVGFLFWSCAGAERIWPPSAARWSVAVPNGDGVASGSATWVLKKNCGINFKKFKKLQVSHQSPFARKALCTTRRAGPLACAAAAVYPAIHKLRPVAAQKKIIIKKQLYQYPLAI